MARPPRSLWKIPRGSIFVLPGVPFELKWLFDNEVAPYLRRKFSLSEIITYRLLKVAELGESRVDDLMGHLIANSRNPTVGVLAHPGQVDIRIAAKADNQGRRLAPRRAGRSGGAAVDRQTHLRGRRRDQWKMRWETPAREEYKTDCGV